MTSTLLTEKNDYNNLINYSPVRNSNNVGLISKSPIKPQLLQKKHISPPAQISAKNQNYEQDRNENLKNHKGEVKSKQNQLNKINRQKQNFQYNDSFKSPPYQAQENLNYLKSSKGNKQISIKNYQNIAKHYIEKLTVSVLDNEQFIYNQRNLQQNEQNSSKNQSISQIIFQSKEVQQNFDETNLQYKQPEQLNIKQQQEVEMLKEDYEQIAKSYIEKLNERILNSIQYPDEQDNIREIQYDKASFDKQMKEFMHCLKQTEDELNESLELYVKQACDSLLSSKLNQIHHSKSMIMVDDDKPWDNEQNKLKEKEIILNNEIILQKQQSINQEEQEKTEFKDIIEQLKQFKLKTDSLVQLNQQPKQQQSEEYNENLCDQQINSKQELIDHLKQQQKQLAQKYQQNKRKPTYTLNKYYKPNEIDIQDYIKTTVGCNTNNSSTIQQQDINYGYILPGYIIEEDVQIENISKSDFLIFEFHVSCFNPEFDSLDEYVYSARHVNENDYQIDKPLDFQESFRVQLMPQEKALFKVAVKVPICNKTIQLLGVAKVSLLGFTSCIKIPIKGYIIVPKITCPKQLYEPKLNLDVVKLAGKEGKLIQCKMPLKNHSQLSLNLEFKILDSLSMYGKQYARILLMEESCVTQCEILTIPKGGTVQGNGQVMITIQIKPKQGLPLKKGSVVKRILMAQIKGSDVFFTYPILIEIY